MTLDRTGDGISRFNDVRVQCPLDEKWDALHGPRLLGKAIDKSGTYGFAFLLGFRDTLQRREEPCGGIHTHKRDIETAMEHRLDTVALPGPEQPGVHKHAREAIADGAVHQRRSDRTVDTARESTERTFVSYSRTDVLDGVIHETRHRPVA